MKFSSSFFWGGVWGAGLMLLAALLVAPAEPVQTVWGTQPDTPRFEVIAGGDYFGGDYYDYGYDYGGFDTGSYEL